jgi:chromosome segregation ATPase
MPRRHGRFYSSAFLFCARVDDESESVVARLDSRSVAVETSDRLEQERRELLRQKAIAEHAADEAQAEISGLRERLLAIETELARAHQTVARQSGDLEAAESRLRKLESDLTNEQRAIREMQGTRAWRLATGYWRLRDRILRRQ